MCEIEIMEGVQGFVCLFVCNDKVKGMTNG